MAGKQRDDPFEVGGWYLAREPGRPSIYRKRFDRGTKSVSRRSLKTADWAEAKRRLSAFVTANPEGDAPSDARQILLVAVFNHYLDHHAPHTGSEERARFSLALINRYLFDERKLKGIMADGFGLSLQSEFAIWAAETVGHSAGTIARSLTVASAAMHFAAREQTIDDPDGGKRTVRLMTVAPEVRHDAEWVAGVARIPVPQKRQWVPTIEQVARFIDCIGSELAFRYIVINLNTWGRASAIMELDFKRQIDRANGLVDLNPPGRLQTVKRRPQIKLTRNLAAWADEWGEARPLSRAGEPVANLKKALQAANARWMLAEAGVPAVEIGRLNARGNHKERTAAIRKLETAGAERITRRVIRTFMATRVRGLKEIRVDREQRQIWLGHLSQDTTALYEITDQDYLRECAQATDLIIEKIGALTKRALWPAGVQTEMTFPRLVKK